MNPWPLKVGDKVRVIHRDVDGNVDFAEDGTIVGARDDIATMLYDNGDWGPSRYSFGPGIDGYAWFLVEDDDRPTLPSAVAPKGANCRRCKEHNPHAEATREDDTYVCYLCRQDGWGITWGDR